MSEVPPPRRPGEARGSPTGDRHAMPDPALAWPWLLGIVAAFAGVQVALGVLEPWGYGIFHDEAYYWACARRPGAGYVDHPPFAPWVLAAGLASGASPRWLLALVPAGCGAALVLVTALMARRLGAGRSGQVLAALCVALAPVPLAFSSFYSVNAFELLFWTLAFAASLELLRTRDPRWWTALGAIAGVALLNKHTFVLCGAALVAGVLATPARRLLCSRWLAVGAALAFALALPNLLWNAANDWPSLAFYRSVGAEKNLPTGLGRGLVLQLAGFGPAATLVWLPGLGWLLLARAGRRYRALGVAFLLLLAIMLLSGQRRSDRIAGAYPLLLAAGAACWEGWSRHAWARRLRQALPPLVATTGVLLLPISLEVLPPTAVIRYFEALGQKPEIEAGDVGHGLPVHLMGRLDWPELADRVGDAFRALPASERAHAAVLAPHWVLASVVEYYGRERGVGPVVSPHNAWWFWRGEAAGRDVVISVGIEPEVLERYFATTRRVGFVECHWCANWRPDMPIQLSRGPVRPLETLLEEWRYFGSDRAPALTPGEPVAQAPAGRRLLTSTSSMIRNSRPEP